MEKNSARPVIIAGKIYVRGADGFRAASAAGIAGTTGSVHQPDGYYVRMPSGVRLHDKDGAPFVFVKRERDSGFIVTCSATSEGIRYMFGASSVDLAKLGLNDSAPNADRLERELAERLLWETSPEVPHTVYELLQRAAAAEADYERDLDRVYGAKRAPDTRYQKHTDETLKAAAQAFVAASEAWHSATRFSQDPAKVHEALAAMAKPATVPLAAKCLVARWTSTETASFAAHGPRVELVMMLARLSDDIDAREPGPAMYDPIPLMDTNGVAVGEAVFVDTSPNAPVDGKPVLIVPVKDFDRAALAVTDVYTKLQSCVEDVHLLSHGDEVPLAHFYWRDLPVLERQWYQAVGATKESLQATHDRLRQRMELQDKTNPDGRFILAYEGIERAAESLDLQACLQGFGDSARVGYFKDGEWTGIASEIALNGKVLTTLNGQRAGGTGYTADREWQHHQLEIALNRYTLTSSATPVDVVEANADLYVEQGGP